jgi:small subunit ribosomal protein S20
LTDWGDPCITAASQLKSGGFLRETCHNHLIKFYNLGSSDTEMANTSSAKKAVRVIERRTIVNRNRRSRIRTFIRKVEEAIESGNYENATSAFKLAEPEIMRGVTKGIYHRNTASRKVSRLSKQVKSLQA